MAKQERVDVLLPVGRLVGSSLYDPRTTDYEGKPLVYKNGDKNGQPRKVYEASIAVRKTQQHWANESFQHPSLGLIEWGKAIWNAGHLAFPQGQAQSPDFAWKITDGDSTKVNKNGNKPCDNEHYRGCWVLHLSSDRPARLVNADGSAMLLDVDAVKPGYWVQAHLNVTGNGSVGNPGVHLTHNAISLQKYDTEIVFGPNVAAMGFGAGGQVHSNTASDTPVGGAMVPPATPATPGNVPPAVPATPTVAGAPVSAAVPAPVTPPVASVPAAVPTPTVAAIPNTGFTAGAIAPPPAPAAPQLVPTANVPAGTTLQQFKDAGWSDDQLIAGGYAIRQ